MTDLAVYDLDRTITRRATYTPFLIHCALRRQQWRLLFVPIVLLAMLAYGFGLFDRSRLKEICQRLLIGPVAIEPPLGHRRLVSLVGDDHEEDVGADVAAGLGPRRGQPRVHRREGAGRVGPFADRGGKSPVS